MSRATKAKQEADDLRRAAAHSSQGAQDSQQNLASASPTLRLAALVTPVEPPGDDPFRPVIPPRRHSQAAPSATSTKPRKGLPLLPPLPDSDSSSVTSRTSQLYLAGVIVGNPSTAVLRWGETRYFVRQGDWLDNDLRVQEIKNDSVTLRDGRSTYVLRLGR